MHRSKLRTSSLGSELSILVTAFNPVSPCQREGLRHLFMHFVVCDLQWGNIWHHTEYFLSVITFPWKFGCTEGHPCLGTGEVCFESTPSMENHSKLDHMGAPEVVSETTKRTDSRSSNDFPYRLIDNVYLCLGKISAPKTHIECRATNYNNWKSKTRITLNVWSMHTNCH